MPGTATASDPDITAVPPGDVKGPHSRPPSRWWYALSLAFIVLAPVVAVIVFIAGLSASAPDTRFVVPGTREVEFEGTGKYNVFWEYRTSLDGVSYDELRYWPPEMDVTLESVDGRHAVPLEETRWNTSYSIGSRSGISLYEFHIDDPGAYLLRAEYRDHSDSDDVVFAVGRFDIVSIVVRSFLLGFAGVLLGLIVQAIVFVKRRRAGMRI